MKRTSPARSRTRWPYRPRSCSPLPVSGQNRHELLELMESPAERENVLAELLHLTVVLAPRGRGLFLASAGREEFQLPPDLLDSGKGLGREERGLHEQLLHQVFRHLLIGNAADAFVQDVEGSLPGEELEGGLIPSVVQPFHERLAELSLPKELPRGRGWCLTRSRAERQRRAGTLGIHEDFSARYYFSPFGLGCDLTG